MDVEGHGDLIILRNASMPYKMPEALEARRDLALISVYAEQDLAGGACRRRKALSETRGRGCYAKSSRGICRAFTK